jgi:2-phospho-L-lactate guanylyltransferase
MAQLWDKFKHHSSPQGKPVRPFLLDSLIPWVINNCVRVVLIAAKHTALAKTRLAPAIPHAEREVLAQAMFRDVLAAAGGSRMAERVAVVSSDRTLLEIAKSAGAMAIDEGAPRGLNAAVRMATSMLVEEGATQVCTLLSDIPLVTGADIDAVFAGIPREGGVVLVPSRDFSGTNIIARAPGDVIGTIFGRLSLVKHLDECRQRAVACEVMRLAGPALDLDLLADIMEFVRVGRPTNTLNQLSRLGIALD